MHNFKNDGQMEISTFPRFLIKMLNYSILDHIYNTYAHRHTDISIYKYTDRYTDILKDEYKDRYT